MEENQLNARWQHLSHLKVSAFLLENYFVGVKKHNNLNLRLVAPSSVWYSPIQALGLTKFVEIIVMNLCTLCCPLKSILGVQQTHILSNLNTSTKLELLFNKPLTTIEIRLECWCLQKCFHNWNNYVGCLWDPLLVLTQSKETVFWSNLVFFLQ